jgi:hypothetical protein
MTSRTSRSRRVPPDHVKAAADRAEARAKGGDGEVRKTKERQRKQADAKAKSRAQADAKKKAKQAEAEAKVLADEAAERERQAEEERAKLFPYAYRPPPEPIDPRKGASKYNKKIHPAMARKLLLAGVAFNDVELANFMSVHPDTIKAWRANHPEFAEALQIDDDEQIIQSVERALYQRATGYKYDSVKVVSYEGSFTYAPITEHVPPDVAAAKYILENRAKDKQGKQKWRDSKTLQLSGDPESPLTVEGDNFNFARRMAYLLAQGAQARNGDDNNSEDDQQLIVDGTARGE